MYNPPPPQKIRLKIPGWAGDSKNHSNGAAPQPWHCLPFIEGSTYGLELIYPFENDCKVINNNGKIEFEGDFSKEKYDSIPFESFAPGHYGFTSLLDIKVSDGYVLRLENHPRYYTDLEYLTPCVVPGHIQTNWWPRIFFVVFKYPPKNHYHIFKKHEPYAQILIIPQKIEYDIMPMHPLDAQDRIECEKLMLRCEKAFNNWTDNNGNNFNDKYKILSTLYAKGGMDAINHYLEATYLTLKKDEKDSSKDMVRILINPKNSHHPN